MGTCMYHVDVAIVRAFQGCLQPLGWKDSDAVTIASKEFQTAVGIKVADIYLFEVGQDIGELEYKLHGSYQSQGRNILETSNAYIPKVHTADELNKFVKEFVENIEAVIAESYAVKIHRLLQQDRDSAN